MRFGNGWLLTCSAWLLMMGACAPGVQPVSPAPPSPSATFTAIPTLTAAPTLAAVATSLPVDETDAVDGDASYYAVVSVDNVNLRTHPGTVFPVRLLLAKGTRVQVLGRAPGSEWLYIQTESNVNGWLLNWLLSGGHDGGPVPLIQPQDVQVIRGKVVDRAGVPISGIGFAVTQGTGPNAPRTDATSDRDGIFYAYLPKAAVGQWYVSYVSVACTSNTMDTTCNCIGACGTADPPGITIALPYDQMLDFTWK